eukprot:TRINITY_DN13099_c0_g1_i2.p1 TRINITY_DN13099_c0_g1~~TRINITY_DN13099_c0_g1_i2.p1  ORF type:complete len:178 (-),score=60.33 TRINITY_DN13099_c0_g1_i2:119-652(-)
MIRRPPRSTQSRSSAASDVYKRQVVHTSSPKNDTPSMTESRRSLQTPSREQTQELSPFQSHTDLGSKRSGGLVTTTLRQSAPTRQSNEPTPPRPVENNVSSKAIEFKKKALAFFTATKKDIDALYKQCLGIFVLFGGDDMTDLDKERFEEIIKLEKKVNDAILKAQACIDSLSLHPV